jgi:UDPglucose--hexose-1-phosphate uridylyltransferase
LAVLPGRLKEELDDITDILCGAVPFETEHWDASHPLHKHISWIQRLVEEQRSDLNKERAFEWIQQEVGLIFLQVLTDAGVYKQDIEGLDAFERFLLNAGLVAAK